MSSLQPGSLYVVATPIGNLGDVTLRALEILRRVDLIAAEDTRHSRRLLDHYGIKTKTISLHEHNEHERSKLLIAELLRGKNIALISDAGTPLISDPGYLLVNQVREKNIEVVPLPGPSAMIAALSVSGLPTDKFIFEGFLPVKTQQLRQQLESFLHETRTVIFYESPHRLLKLVEAMMVVFGQERQVVLAKEMTKIYETILRTTLQDLCNWLQEDPSRQKGEFVLLLSGVKEEHRQLPETSVEEIVKTLLAELSLKSAVNLAIKLTGEKKNKIYAMAVKMQADRSTQGKA